MLHQARTPLLCKKDLFHFPFLEKVAKPDEARLGDEELNYYGEKSYLTPHLTLAQALPLHL